MMQFVNKRKRDMKRNSVNNNNSSIGSQTNRNSIRTSDNGEHKQNFMNQRKNVQKGMIIQDESFLGQSPDKFPMIR
jgi:hypothetical protein